MTASSRMWQGVLRIRNDTGSKINKEIHIRCNLFYDLNILFRVECSLFSFELLMVPRDFPEFEILNKYIKDSIQLDYEYSITPPSQFINVNSKWFYYAKNVIKRWIQLFIFWTFMDHESELLNQYDKVLFPLIII